MAENDTARERAREICGPLWFADDESGKRAEKDIAEAIREERERAEDIKGEVEDALGAAGVWGNVECEAQTYTEAIEILRERADDAEAAEKRAAALELALEEYGQHHVQCDDRIARGESCTCGLDKALRYYDGALVEHDAAVRRAALLEASEIARKNAVAAGGGLLSGSWGATWQWLRELAEAQCTKP